MATSIFIVEIGDAVKLVEAKSKAAAVKHVLKDTISAYKATAKEVADLLGEGSKVEVAE